MTLEEAIKVLEKGKITSKDFSEALATIVVFVKRFIKFIDLSDLY